MYLWLSHTLFNLDFKEFNEEAFITTDSSLYQESAIFLLKNLSIGFLAVSFWKF